MKMYPTMITLLLAVLLQPLSGSDSYLSETRLIIAAFQFEVSSDLVSSYSTFSSAVEKTVGKAVQESLRQRGVKPDLIIFPEYIGVLAGLIPYGEQVGTSETFTEAFRMVSLENPEIHTLNDLFRKEAVDTDRYLDSLFGSLGARYQVSLLGGTRFALRGGVGDGSTDLVNRAVTYGPDGGRMYVQDKVYLTDF